jgi:hypothetical protein
MTTIPHNRSRASYTVGIRENILRARIIVPIENKSLAWGGSRWIRLKPDGLAAGDLKPVSFTTLEGAAAYAESQGFKVEQP